MGCGQRTHCILDCAYADHEASAKAIVKGLRARDPATPGFLIHTSGTGVLLIDDISVQVFGEDSSKIYDDLEGVGKVTSLPDDAPHRNVDKIVLAAGAESEGHVKTAVVCPPTIYGTGRGPGNQRSHQVPELARCTLEQGHGIQVNAGKTYWSNVHVHDLSDLYLKLAENAAAGGSLAEWPNKPAIWGPEGYYFSENGEHVWGDVSQMVAKEAKKHGWVKTDEVKSVSADEASKLTPFGHALWGANSRSRAKRAREVLGWKPSGVPLKDTIKDTVEWEAKSLELKPGHAKVAAGDA